MQLHAGVQKASSGHQPSGILKFSAQVSCKYTSHAVLQEKISLFAYFIGRIPFIYN
jgi:hypothetical protein